MAIMLTKPPKLCYIGMAWIMQKQRPIYGCREIRRGRRKGLLEVIYLAAPEIYKKTLIEKTDIIKEAPCNNSK